MKKSDKYRIDEKPGYIVIKILIDRLDLFQTPDILTGVESFLKEKGYPSALVDLSDTAVIDSTGIGFLIAVNNIILKNGGNMLITGISERVGEIFRITKMNGFFKSVGSHADAEKVFTGGGENR